MEELINVVSNPHFESLVRILLTGGMVILLVQVRIILRRIRLSEFKQVATIHALGKSFGNGFMEYYKDKLDNMIEEYNFKTGK